MQPQPPPPTLAPPLASGSIALNTSAIYLGQAIGTAGGGVVYARAGVEYLPWFGVVFLVMALLLSVTISRRVKQKGPAQ